MNLKTLFGASALALCIFSPAAASTFLVDVNSTLGPFDGTLTVESAIDTSGGYDAHRIVGFTGTYDGEAFFLVPNPHYPLPGSFGGQLYDQVYTTDLGGVTGSSFGAFGALFCAVAVRCLHLSAGNTDSGGAQAKVLTNGTWGNPVLTDLVFTPHDNGVVPEPGTWALMILGFGITGGALRTRRRTAFAC